MLTKKSRPALALRPSVTHYLETGEVVLGAGDNPFAFVGIDSHVDALREVAATKDSCDAAASCWRAFPAGGASSGDSGTAVGRFVFRRRFAVSMRRRPGPSNSETT